MVGFDQMVYMVGEAEGSVVVTITREQGTAVVPLTITLRTLDVNFTATGNVMCSYACVELYVHICQGYRQGKRGGLGGLLSNNIAVHCILRGEYPNICKPVNAPVVWVLVYI